MSSSYVEVRETENGTDENALPIAIDTCESNGIVPMSPIDGEPQKDHTYNKEPLEVQGEVEVLVSSEEVEDMEVSITSPEKAKRAKKQKTSPSKKANKVARSPVKKESPKKSPSPKKKVVTKEKDKPKVAEKEEEEEAVSDSEDKLDDSLGEKDSSPTKKRGQKRKAETTKATEKEPKAKREKLDVKKSKVVKPKGAKKEESDSKEVEQTGNDVGKTEEDITDVKEIEEKSPTKPAKKNLKAPSKTLKKTASSDASRQDDSTLPKGWTRKVVQRKSGKTAGQFDVYIYSPDGKKLRSKPDIAAYLAKTNSPLTIDDFNFSLRPGSGTPSSPPAKKSAPAPAKTKSVPKSPSVVGKKKTAANNSKKGVRLVVKLNFSPKKRILSNYEEQEKTEKLGGAEKSEGGKKPTPKKSSAKRQKAQTKKKTPTKQTAPKK